MNRYFKLFIPLLFISLCLSQSAFAAFYSDTLHPGKDTSKAKHADPSNDETTDEEQPQQFVIRPIIGLGTGMLSYIGNVKQFGITNIQNPMSGRVGYDLTLTQQITPVTEFSLYFLYGDLALTQRTINANWTFQSQIAGGGIHFLFQFLPKQEVSPYAIIGVETYEFLSRADIYDVHGNEYYYWTDGSIRSLPQTSPNAAQASILEQDYLYGTDIRSLNLDGSGNYNEQAFAVPVGVGLMFHIGESADFTVGTTLHYTFTDRIDGLTPQVPGSLQGSSKNDMFLMTEVGLRINLTKIRTKHKPHYADVDITDTVKPVAYKDNPQSDSAMERQYEMYMDSTGKFGLVQTDAFHWKVANAVAAANAKKNGSNSVTPSASSGSNTSTGGEVTYVVQLLATRVKLAEGISFAGINDKAAVYVENDMYRYTTGSYANMNDAGKYLNQLKAIGYTDAFIRASKDGKLIPAGQAVQATSAAAATNATAATNSAGNPALGTGLVYKIQLGVYGAIAPDQTFMSQLNQFPDMSIVKDNAGLNHYLAGSYSSFKEATDARDKAKQGGMKDVCIMAFFNGHYISNNEAQNREKK